MLFILILLLAKKVFQKINERKMYKRDQVELFGELHIAKELGVHDFSS